MEGNNPDNTAPKEKLSNAGWKGWKAELKDCFKDATIDLFETLLFFASGVSLILVQGAERGQKSLDILFNNGFNLLTVMFWIGFLIITFITSKIVQGIFQLIGSLCVFILKIIWYTLVFLFKIITVWEKKK